MEKEKEKKKSKLRIVLYLLFWGFILSAFGGLAIIQLGRYEQVQSELARVEEEVAREKEAHQELLDQMAYYESDAYVEQLARDLLGYVKPDEIVFINAP